MFSLASSFHRINKILILYLRFSSLSFIFIFFDVKHAYAMLDAQRNYCKIMIDLLTNPCSAYGFLEETTILNANILDAHIILFIRYLLLQFLLLLFLLWLLLSFYKEKWKNVTFDCFILLSSNVFLDSFHAYKSAPNHLHWIFPSSTIKNTSIYSFLLLSCVHVFFSLTRLSHTKCVFHNNYQISVDACVCARERKRLISV